MMNDKQLLSALEKLAPTTVATLAKALKADPATLRQRLQRLKREGFIVVSRRARYASVTECSYALAAQLDEPTPFVGNLSAQQIKDFGAQVKVRPGQVLLRCYDQD